MYVSLNHGGKNYSYRPIDVLAMAEYCLSIIILSSISLRPLLRRLWSVTTESRSTPVTPSTRAPGTNMVHHFCTNSSQLSKSWRKGSDHTDGVYPESGVQPGYGSEVELTDIEMGRINKTQKVRVTSTHEETNDNIDGRSTDGASL
jgi:hypothetical protein